MKLTYDKETDAAYIYFEFPLKEGKVKETVEVNDFLILDFDADHKLLGVEILNASKVLHKETLLA
ncbi:MAG: DUF2283 domain-containing protein [Nanoarchaeota archaeon]